MSTGTAASFVPRLIRRLSIPIAIIWLALAASVTPDPAAGDRAHPQRRPERQGRPSLIAAKRVGTTFGEYDTDSLVTLVIEGDQPLGDAAHRFGDALVERMQADTAHVQHVQYFWGDPLTAAGSQSNDGKAALIQVYLDGDAGSSQANEVGGLGPRDRR